MGNASFIVLLNSVIEFLESISLTIKQDSDINSNYNLSTLTEKQKTHLLIHLVVAKSPIYVVTITDPVVIN